MPHTMTTWTQALLGRNMLLASQDVEEVRSRIAQLLNDHVLEPQGSRLAARLHGVRADALSLWMLEYGDAVSIEETRPGGDFVLVQMPLSGVVQVECAEGSWTVGPGTGLIMPSDIPHRLDWEAGATQIILKVPLGRLLDEYKSLTGTLPARSLKFDRQVTLDAVDGAQWSALMRYFCEQLAHPSPLGWLKARSAEEALMRHLLCVQSGALREHFLGGDRVQIPQRLARARQFMETHLHEDITLTDIAQYSGASPRSLARMCRLQYGLSPMQLLRDLRLDKIRGALQQASVDSNVSEVAMSYGYGHLGRFAGAYRERFGEAPHETLADARRRRLPCQKA